MRYVAVFAFSASLAGFCVEDFLSVAETLNVTIAPVNNQAPWMRPCGAENQFYIFDSPATVPELSALAARCVLLRGLYRLLQACPSLDALYDRCALLRSAGNDDDASPTTSSTSSTTHILAGDAEELFSDGDFCYSVETIGRKYSGETKKDVIDRVLSTSPLPREQRQGTVNYTSPRHRFYVFVQHRAQEAPVGATHFSPDGPVMCVVHCVQLVESGRSALLSRYDLRWRPYVGTTSMPAEEATLMANVARLRPGQVAMDPFCGTGSLLVAAAHSGAHTLGSDADGRAMRAGTAKGKTSPQLQMQRQLAMSHYSERELAEVGVTAEEQALPSMLTNFKVYRLPPPDRIRLNFSTWPHMWRGKGGFLDAILTDPPYGLREPRKKGAVVAPTPSRHDSVAAETKGTTDLPAVADPKASASKAADSRAYHTNEVVLDLILFAAEFLVVGGFLVFWHPTTDHFTEEELPTHPSLKLLSCTPQRLSLKVVRRLVVMTKTAVPPSPRPSRESCAPKRSADDLRALMDVTEIPDNPSYTHYRQRVANRRDATSQYIEQQRSVLEQQPPSATAEDAAGATGDSVDGPVRGRRRIETQQYIVQNRARKLKLRDEKQKASHEENLRRQQELNAQRKRESE